jgi:hypothetical protein
VQRQPAVADRRPDRRHCTHGTAVARVWFDENTQNNSEYPFGGATSYEGVPYPYPGLRIGTGTGCRASPLATSHHRTHRAGPDERGQRVRQLPSAGLVDELTSKAPVTRVGYGYRSGSWAAARRCGPDSGSG